MTIWEMRELCKAKMNDHSLTEQQRKAYENALKSLEVQIQLMDVDSLRPAVRGAQKPPKFKRKGER